MTTTLIIGLDTSILNVAIPTILREFDTTLAQLQWVIAGYSLTFGAFLVIGGRLTDIHGARRMFIVGASLFAIGSFIAMISTGVPMLVVGEGIIEGIGAAMMLPASLSIINRTFEGRERATAFAMWTAGVGAAVAFGPIVGGFLTTEYSWRWAFGINVIIAPLAALGVRMLTSGAHATGVREPLDIPGALLIASGMSALVFGISQGETYGWWAPVRGLVIGGVTVWPADAPVSVAPAAFVLAFVLLFAFYRLERWKEKRDAWPLLQFSMMRDRSFSAGLVTLLLISAGQVTLILVVSVVLQNANDLSAVETGTWLLPSGIAIIVGSQVGGWLARRIDVIVVVRIGLLAEALGLAMASVVLGPDVTMLQLAPCFILYGAGIGFAASQITNVILRDMPHEKSGVAGATTSTARMVGVALGIATVSAILGAVTIHNAVSALRDDTTLSTKERTSAIAHVEDGGVAASAPPGSPKTVAAAVNDAMGDAIGNAADFAVKFGAVVVFAGFGVSFFIPRAQRPESAEILAAPSAEVTSSA